jgi:O-antigen/teichoic acid export membrane protein
MLKIIVIIAFLLILASLANALYNLIVRKPEERSKNTVKALTVRIGLSLLLFIFVFFAVGSGLIKPHGIGATIQQHRIAAQQQAQPRQ